ncbi:family 78 glycoside hydrolase catalytic domain [Emticicia sp. CRIBPO]|uniref:alpha-L-rhamnosidase n=1 Tax=Emticicia sp. CRIBPO TaxID=2683258 RepID=UPI0014132B09|nr:alpha-L-rhamnosidase [Emticicia sp. CRIBPO]NBA89038.1 family 78 glycoside hydrolase catalytic domain [Emticicia sp. CRIBPO]
MKKSVLFITLLLSFGAARAQLAVKNLLLENQVNPVGLDIRQPRFSWALQSGKRNVKQTAYELKVTAGKEVVWNTGKTSSEQSAHLIYAGKALKSGQKYQWQVKVWDNQGQTSEWSAPAVFQTALMDISEWKASWIEPEFGLDTNITASPVLRKQFSAAKKIVSATAYITAHGLYEAQINGQRVGDAYLSPGWTVYDKHLQYQTYDVTALVRKGKNAVGVTLASGWYRGHLGWEMKKNTYGKDIALLFQMNIVYSDGSTELVVSDGSWKASTAEITYADLYNGETIDARLAKNGWSSPDYNDAAWQKVIVREHSKSNLSANYNEPIKKHEVFKPVKVITTPKGDKVLDFGQNLVGWVKLKVSGKSGDKITVSHVEVMDKKGELYFENLRLAKAQDHYILKGGGGETFEPHFTFHGFRYIRVEGLSGALNPDDFEAVALYSDMKPLGSFESSSALVNQLQKNIQWGQKGNFLDVPTDCPQRDERLGWTGDAEVFSRTAAYNFNVNSFFAKWLKDVAFEQNANGSIPFVVPNTLKGTFFNMPSGAAGWSDAGIIIPWNLYVVYGDKRLIETQYPSMKAYLEHVRKAAKNDLWNTGFQFGDWLSYRVDDSQGMIGQKSAVTDNYLVAQCFYAYNVDLMIKTARALGKTDDVKDFEALLGRVRTAFQKEYMSSNGRLISETQTAYLLALSFDMMPESVRPYAVERLENNIKSYNYHLTTGFLGTPFLTSVLTRFGKNDVAYRLLLQETYPSWLYPVKMGATTIWERWDSMKPDSSFASPSMTSFNHYAYGAVGDWLYRDVVGIDTDENAVGYKEIIIKPHPGDGLTYAKGSFETYYGTVSAHWKTEGKAIKLDVEIPANTTATIYFPSEKQESVIESTGEVKASGKEKGYTVFKVGSGKYQFSGDK